MSTNDYERYQTELEFASILGMPYMGTGNDPTSANNRNIEPVDDRRREVGGPQRPQPAVGDPPLPAQPLAGVQLPPGRPDGHRHRGPCDRRADPPTVVRGESGKRLMQHYLDITDPDLCVIEMDIFWAHVAQHQWRWRYDWDGNRVEDIFDPLDQVARQTMRYALFHAKDGDRTAQPPGVGNGYNIIPFGDRGATSTSRRSSRTWAPRATTTRTTSRTTRPAVAPIPDSRCATPRSVPTTCWRCEADAPLPTEPARPAKPAGRACSLGRRTPHR